MSLETILAIVGGIVATFVVGGHYRRRAVAAEAVGERVVEVAERDAAHSADLDAIATEMEAALAGVDAEYADDLARIASEGQQPGEDSVDALNRLRDQGAL